MSNINQRLTDGRIRFKRGWNNRPVNSLAGVAEFGFGLCQSLVDCGKADWIDEETQAASPASGSHDKEGDSAAETEEPPQGGRRRGNGGKRSA